MRGLRGWYPGHRICLGSSQFGHEWEMDDEEITDQANEFDCSSPGAYFVTICTYNMVHLFGQIRRSTAHLRNCGRILRSQLHRTQRIRPDIFIEDM
jgi:hypothetical protein